MDGKCSIEISNDKAYIRFSRVEPPGPPGTFDNLIMQFYRTVPSATWNREERWMEVDLRDLEILLDFCYREFGVGKTRIRHRSQKPGIDGQLHIGF